MRKGQKVICINDNFPWMEKYGGNGEQANIKPSIGEVICIDEILGEYLRFEKYDTPESYNWWHSSRFKPCDEEETLASALESLRLAVNETINANLNKNEDR